MDARKASGKLSGDDPTRSQPTGAREQGGPGRLVGCREAGPQTDGSRERERLVGQGPD